jgi:hypothetical protein
VLAANAWRARIDGTWVQVVAGLGCIDAFAGNQIADVHRARIVVVTLRVVCTGRGNTTVDRQGSATLDRIADIDQARVQYVAIDARTETDAVQTSFGRTFVVVVAVEIDRASTLDVWSVLLGKIAGCLKS